MKGPLAVRHAKELALQMVERLQPHCSRVQIVGSLRRNWEDDGATCGDIEILYAPVPSPLVDEPRSERDYGVHLVALAEMEARGLISKRLCGRTTKWGPRFQAAELEGVQLDLFACLEPAQWGVLSAIRTGPKKLSHAFATHSPYGHMPAGHRMLDGAIHRVDAGVLHRLPMPEEDDFFRFLGFHTPPPAERSKLETLPARFRLGEAHA